MLGGLNADLPIEGPARPAGVTRVAGWLRGQPAGVARLARGFKGQIVGKEAGLPNKGSLNCWSEYRLVG